MALVEGIGDEVVLFGAFLFLSMCMLVYVSLRSGQANATGRRGEQQQHRPLDGSDIIGEQDDIPADTNLDRQPFGTRANNDNQISDETSESTRDQSRLQSDNHSHEEQSEESTLRSRFPQTQGARTTEEDNNEGSLSIRLILPNSSTLQVNIQLSTTLGEIRRTYFQEQLAEHRPVRFIYQGRVLDNDSLTLQDLEIGSQHAIHVHIGRPRPPDTEGAQNFGPQPPREMLDLSRLFFPLFGLILAICWVSLFCYPHVFSLLTKVLLFILSLAYVFMTYASTWTTPTLRA